MRDQVTSFSRTLGGKVLGKSAAGDPTLRPRALFPRATRIDDDHVIGKSNGAKSMPGDATQLSRGLDKRLTSPARFGHRNASVTSKTSNDPRQRVIVKIHFFGHGGGGSAALKAHGRYLQRDPSETEKDINAASGPARLSDGRAHADYLSRDGVNPFYDQFDANVDGAARLAVWAREDKRHFRLILAAENGAELGNLRPFVRDVMAQAESALGAQLEWVAVDHWDTANPHTHIVLRGRQARGRPLMLPRDFVKHGLRNIARDLATARLGDRTPAQERRALMREARAHRPSQLDRLLAQQMSQTNVLNIGRIALKYGNTTLENALKARARELLRLGLAQEIRRNLLHMDPDWRGRLSRIELHLDIRKRLNNERVLLAPPNKRSRDSIRI